MSAANDYYQHAVGAFDQQLFCQAMHVARLGLAEFPEDPRLWQVLGTSLWCVSDVEQAQDALETASCLAPLGPLARFTLGLVYARLGKNDLARTVFEYLVEPDRCPTGMLHKLAAACGQIEEHELALQACETLAQRNPAHHGAHFGIAYYKTRLGHPLEEVMIPLSLAMDLAPGLLSYRMNLVFVWTEMGEYGKAYDLLADVPVQQIFHPCWLRKMIIVFDHFDDLDRLSEALLQLEKSTMSAGEPSGGDIL